MINTSPAAADGSLLRLPFDQYGRYHMVQEALDAAADALGASQLRVLDVGGFFRDYTGTPLLPAQLFLPRHDVTVLDLPACDLPGYVQGDGKDLTFPDASFDFVITCDTLEHIPAPDRARFCGELLRVARLGVLLICPFGDPRVVLAERIVSAYIRAEFDLEQPQLQEHGAFGLPDMTAVRKIFDDAGCPFHAYPSGAVFAWLPMMIAKHYLSSLSDDAVLHTGLDELYNLSYALNDRREPSYRRLFVVAKDNAHNWLEAADNALAPTIRPPGMQDDDRSWLALTTQLMSLLQLGIDDRRDTRHNEYLRGQIAYLQRYISERDRQIADYVRHIDVLGEQVEQAVARTSLLQDALLWREGQIDELHKRIAWLEGQAHAAQSQLAAVQNGFVMRILRRIK